MIDSAEEFVRLRTSEVQEEYTRASVESASLEVWTDVVLRFPHMREWVVHNKAVPPEILELLSRDGSESVRAAVAMKRKLSADLFTLLANDASEVVRARLAYNQKLPPALLRALANDSSPLVREASHRRLRESGMH
ncbi:hypothetical protein ACO2Q9_20370 [Variovorax sp. VNK109]|jgi:hypothetical protein|uniref:hypothetical protein n=1 Tax=Variovorax sp. VNK109 TaxID=3400919 RepID=UPI003C0C6C9C